MLLSEEEFLNWFEKDNGIHETYGAAKYTYDYFANKYEKRIMELEKQIEELKRQQGVKSEI